MATIDRFVLPVRTIHLHKSTFAPYNQFIDVTYRNIFTRSEPFSASSYGQIPANVNPWDWPYAQSAPQQQPPAGPPARKIYRLFDGKSRLYHTSTTSDRFRNHNKNEGLAFCALESAPSGVESVPVLLHNLPRGGGLYDFFITNNETTRFQEAGTFGYEFMGTLGYLYKYDIPEYALRTVYRFWNSTALHHAYTTNPFEYGIIKSNFKAGNHMVFEGITGFAPNKC